MLVHYFQVNTRLFRVPFISTAASDLGAGHIRHYTTPSHNRGEQREMTSQLVAAKSTKTYNIMRILPFLRHEFSQYGSILPGCCYLLYFFCICS